ncbi:Cell division control protein/predicted DNA repair exonuclease [Phaffia rhodozyma]|uniref:Cell division control protein/predicted DNA repair exonuclease n=1 Tax=Phaffia rhodozyma TaxID=264483 RepID=A0A0F7SSX1_PHARH|nr:Cell division control protein/predicted DNA repair exonuclease [Phaffia rhodozyma]
MSSNVLRRRRSAVSQSASIGLRFGWIVVVIWCEIGEFFWSASACRWSSLEKRLQRSSNLPSRSTRVLIIADPQVINFESSSARQRPFRSLIDRFIIDTFLKKSWSIAQRFKPDAVFFLGDMMHSGRAATLEGEYWSYASRFKQIFKPTMNVPVYYIPGNHDVGLGPSRAFSTRARERYKQAFGEINHTVDIGNHTFVLLDAPGIIEEDYRRYADQIRFGDAGDSEGGSIDFVVKLSENKTNFPRILLTHVPLHRRERVDCGPLREKGHIVNGAGLGYQKLLGRETSEFLMERIAPTLIFSGDDHDICEYSHPNGVREVTVKAFTMALEVSQPGFQILSLVPSDPAEPSLPTHADMACNLPDQLGIYNHIYLPLALLTVLFLLFVNIRRSIRMRAYPKSINLQTSNFSAPPTPSMSRVSSSAGIAGGALKSPRLPTSSSGLQPPGAIRRPSRSVPPSPLGSPKQLSSELDDAEIGGYPSEPNRLSYDFPDSYHNSEEYLPGLVSTGSSGGGGSGQNVGLGIFGAPLPSPSARPGIPRRPTRMDSRKLASAASASEDGVLSSWREVARDFSRSFGLGRRFWNSIGGEEGLVARWTGECFGVFWPSFAVYLVVNFYYFL